MLSMYILIIYILIIYMIAALGSDHIHNNKYCKKYKDGRFENLSKIARLGF